jgi:hypothetical protein
MNTTPLEPLRLLRRAEAAEHIRGKWGYPCSPKTLAKYAVVGGGPPFRKAGRYPLYHPDDLDDWINGKLSDVVTSTSALVRARPWPLSEVQNWIAGRIESRGGVND